MAPRSSTRTHLLLALAVLLCPTALRAQSSARSAEAHARSARDAYHSLDLDDAQQRAEAAVAACERSGCPGADMARYLVLQGVVQYAVTQDRDRTQATFRRAVQADGGVQLDPELATPELQEIFVAARGSDTRGVSLSPGQAAADLPEELPTAHEGGACARDADCSGGLVCESDRCVAGEHAAGGEFWERFFLEVGFNMSAATASDRLTPTDAPTLALGTNGSPTLDPQLDTDPTNDSYFLGGTNGCSADAPTGGTATADNYCVRVTNGVFVFAPGIHVGLGAWITDRVGVSLRARIGIGHGGGSLSFIQLGARFHYRVIVPRPEGLHMSVYLGAAYGQIQVRPKQVRADRIWGTTGPLGIDVGMNVGYRFTPNVGIFVQPGIYALLPDFSLGLSATVGVDLAIGSVGAAPAPAAQPVPEATDDDRDGDRILNHNDTCPDDAEDIDGYEDRDGCPEPDNDGDGIPDITDNCPREAEDMDRFEDTDGCPERDNDGDGVADVEDACPNEVGVGISRGCPEPDRDGDGVADRLDNCPNEAGPVENRGCIEEQFVEIQEGRLVITQIIYFRTNRDVIEQRSYPLLQQIANVLNGHPEITHILVEGHTDSRGRARNNLLLSQRRARAVVTHLTRTGGVAAGRLSSEGYGSTRPVVENATSPEEHAQNRRVEFVIQNR